MLLTAFERSLKVVMFLLMRKFLYLRISLFFEVGVIIFQPLPVVREPNVRCSSAMFLCCLIPFIAIRDSSKSPIVCGINNVNCCLGVTMTGYTEPGSNWSSWFAFNFVEQSWFQTFHQTELSHFFTGAGLNFICTIVSKMQSSILWDF